jgi:hypothetical protein
MKTWSLTLEFNGQLIPLSIESPLGGNPIDDYREVNFVLADGDKRRAVFFLLPNATSDDPYSVMSHDKWTVPVRWDDNTMLFVPSLSDENILAAIKYILNNGLEDEAFECAEDIDFND